MKMRSLFINAAVVILLLEAAVPSTMTDAFTISSPSAHLLRHTHSFSTFYEKPSTSLSTKSLSSRNHHHVVVLKKLTSCLHASNVASSSNTDDDDSAPSSTHHDIKPLCINMKFSVKPECRDEFLSFILKQQKEVLSKEETTLQYVVGEDVSTPNTFYIHQQYLLGDDDAHHHTAPTNELLNNDYNWFANDDDQQPIIEYYYGHHTPQQQQIPIRSAYCVHVELYINPSLLTEFTPVIQNNSYGSNNDEPLCLQYVYGESTTTSYKFIFHEEYDGKKGFDAHTNSPHFKVWEEFASKDDAFTKDPVVHFFKSIVSVEKGK